MHTYVRTYVHTYVHTTTHTYKHISVHIDSQAICIYIYTNMHTSVFMVCVPDMSTLQHVCMHIYMHIAYT